MSLSLDTEGVDVVSVKMSKIDDMIVDIVFLVPQDDDYSEHRVESRQDWLMLRDRVVKLGTNDVTFGTLLPLDVSQLAVGIRIDLD